ncbi:PAS domain S-box protein [Natrarchaeobius oligotrophus]|uniref:PAS domain S-box protein n=2 Tax=Natrarchaeobius TaxID=2501796 RepID=A0A3N6PI87_NATCH|nr:PAS domain S-box protein [Natrarchaeobius chitinivorans]
MAALESSVDVASTWRERELAAALDRLERETVHCVVCEFDPAAVDPALESLAARAGAVPIVAITDGEAANRALEAGATDAVDPGDDPSVMAARVENVAHRYRLADDRSSDRHRAILDSADVLVWIVDDRGTVDYASPAVETRLGYTADELERTTLLDLVHPDDRALARDVLSVTAGDPIGSRETITLRLGDSDGIWQLVELTAVNRLDDPIVEGLVVTASEAASAVDEDVETAIGRLRDPFFTLGSDWELRYANESARRLLSERARPGTIVWDVLPESIRDPFHERLQEAATTDSVVEFEITDPTADGRLAVTAEPDDDGLTVHARERTTRDARSPYGVAESRRLRERLELLESTVDALEDGVAVLEDGTIRLANASLLELTGEDALLGREIDAVFDDALAETVRERARSPVVRWMDPVRGELDSGRSVDVFVAPLPNDERTVCVVRDRWRSGAASLSLVSRAVTTLASAETSTEIRRSVVEAVRSCAGGEFAGWFLVDDGTLRPATVTTRDQSTGIDPRPVSLEGTSIADALGADGPTTYERATADTFLSRSGIRAERVLAVPVSARNVVVATSTDPLAFESIDPRPIEALADAASTALDRLEQRTRAREERRLRTRLEDAIDAFDRVRAGERAILAAGSREDVERRLCEAIVGLDPVTTAGTIDLAWVGRVDDATETVAPNVRIGRDGDVLESAPFRVDPDAAEPTGRSAATRTLVVDAFERGRANADDDSAWIGRLDDRGFRSGLSVPIEHETFRYGLLTAYADDPSTFDERIRRVCEHLATVAGHAIGAIERKRALLADSVVELEVVLRSDDEPLSTIAHRLGSRLDVRAIVPRSSGGSTVYCTVASGEDAGEGEIDSLADVEAVERVGNATTESAIELVLEESTVAETIAEHGGTIRSIVPVDDRTRLVFDLPETAEVRSFVDALERVYPGTELVARREHDRSMPSERAFDATISDRLSDQQRRTLETAYYAGFFEWPRERTGEEVATSLGVSQPTFSRHIRTAQRKLLELLFEERTDE